MDARLVSRHRFYFTKSLVCHWLWEELRYNMLQHGSSAMDNPFDYNTTPAKRESKVDDSCLFILHPDNFHKLCRQNLGTSDLTNLKLIYNIDFNGPMLWRTGGKHTKKNNIFKGIAAVSCFATRNELLNYFFFAFYFGNKRSK